MIATDEDDDGDGDRLELVGVADLLDALVDGEHAAQAEQDDGDDERPEVPLAAVAERVLGGRRPLRPPAAEQQQRLVARVGHRVDALGQHRARAGDQEADELGDGDAALASSAATTALVPCPPPAMATT